MKNTILMRTLSLALTLLMTLSILMVSGVSAFADGNILFESRFDEAFEVSANTTSQTLTSKGWGYTNGDYVGSVKKELLNGADTYYLRFNSSKNTCFRISTDGYTTGELKMTFKCRFPQGYNGSYAMFIGRFNGTGTSATYKLDARLQGGKLNLRNANGTISTGSITFGDNQWHDVEIGLDLDNLKSYAILDNNSATKIEYTIAGDLAARYIGFAGSSANGSKATVCDIKDIVVSRGTEVLHTVDYLDDVYNNDAKEIDAQFATCLVPYGWNGAENSTRAGYLGKDNDKHYLELSQTGTQGNPSFKISGNDDELTTGKIKMSFKYKLPADGSEYTRLTLLDNNCIKAADGKGFSKLSDKLEMLEVGGLTHTAGTFTTDSWHNVTYIFDLDNRVVTGQIDNGVVATADLPTIDSLSGIKSIGFVPANSENTTKCHIADIVVEKVVFSGLKLMTNGAEVSKASLSNLAGTNVKVQVDMDIYDADIEKVTLICAFYDGNKMADVKYETVNLTEAGTITTGNLLVKSDITPDSAKVFLWKGEITDIEPIIPATEY